MMTYTANGQQVLCNGAHFADVIDPASARFVADVLNDRARRDPVVPSKQQKHLPLGDDMVMPVFPSKPHHIRLESDEYACSCGARWDADDGEEHP